MSQDGACCRNWEDGKATIVFRHCNLSCYRHEVQRSLPSQPRLSL
ncbi:hypothetical protein NC653_033019 [Populus alba x Populus x berolinensis]|uniref:Uncharacterized protein n=1 Tax=Populus alba x Populus x berolinensis TaxID=444605 RepID=A0AAD6LSM4_9ROSI|nr:hypothetical protein NC653_033019 [Populus alba x Populus x berolinensis]